MEVDTLLGDASKARQRLGWQPEVSFGELVREMVLADSAAAAAGAAMAQLQAAEA
jgi:GDPmannose 4,6-dehydratase